MCKVIKGYVMHNRKKSSNVKEYFEYPRILLLNNEIKENEKENDKDNDKDKDKDNDKNNENDKEKNNNSINQDEQLYLLKLIENKISKIKPDIVIIGKDFPEIIVNTIVNNNSYDISVIYNIDSSVIKKLSRCFQSLVLPSIKLIGNNNFIGICEKFYIQKYTDNNINNENNNKQELNNKEDGDNNINNKNEENNDLYIFLMDVIKYYLIQ